MCEKIVLSIALDKSNKNKGVSLKNLKDLARQEPIGSSTEGFRYNIGTRHRFRSRRADEIRVDVLRRRHVKIMFLRRV